MSDLNEDEVFELCCDFSGVAEGQYDAVLERFDGCEGLWLQSIPRSIANLPSEVWFWASLDRVKSRDFLLTDIHWTVCSNSMIEMLRSLGEFPHIAIPAHFREARDGLDGTLEDEYSVLVITEALEVLDWSKAKVLCRDDGSLLRVKKWEFLTPLDGFPPVFRPKEKKTSLLISRAAKEALEQGEITGIEIVGKDKIGLQ